MYRPVKSGPRVRWRMICCFALALIGAEQVVYGTISFDRGNTTDWWFNNVNWTSNLLPPFNNTTVDANGFYTTNPTDTDIGASGTGLGGPYSVTFDPAMDPNFNPSAALATSPPRPLAYGYNNDGSGNPAFVIWRLYLSSGTSTSNTLTIKSGTLIQRDSGASTFGTAGTAQANIGRQGTGIVNQMGGTFIQESNVIDLGQTQNSIGGNGTWNYYGGTLEAGLLNTLTSGSGNVAGFRLGAATASGAVGAAVGTMRVYNTGADGHIRAKDFQVSSGSGNNGSQGTVEFHFGLNQQASGGVRPIQVTRGLTINNSAANLQSSRLNLVLDAAPTVAAGIPQSLGLFDVDFDPLDAFTGSTSGTFYDWAGANNLAEGSTVSATFGATTYDWTISYTGNISWTDANNSVISSITGAGTGKDVVLIGLDTHAAILLGDLDFSNTVTIADVQSLLAALSDVVKYKSDHSIATDDDLRQRADIDQSGAVDNKDVQALIVKLANTGGGTLSAVPEPASWFLLMGGAAGLGFAASRRHNRRHADPC